MLRRVYDRGRNCVRLRHLTGLTDDDNETSATLPSHVRCNPSGELPWTYHLGLEMPQYVINRNVIDRACDVSAGIAADNVDVTEVVDDVIDQRGDIGRAADVGDEAFRASGA